MGSWINLDFGWTQMLEIGILALMFYYVLLFLRGTRGAQVLTGMIVSIALMFLLTNFLRLNTLNWMIQQLSVFLPLAFIIIFQPEIRRALAELGRPHVFSGAEHRREVVDLIIEAVTQLADSKIGALIAIEREIGLGSITQTGTKIDSSLSAELLASIFYPRTPLHDGGVIIQGDRLLAAGCLFPLSQKEELSSQLGTRHRAAIGLTEDSDAIVVVVSEETGNISLSYNGKLRRGLDDERLTRMLSSLMLRGKFADHPTLPAKTPSGLFATKSLESEEEL
jgi:diadenylate cyclase